MVGDMTGPAAQGVRIEWAQLPAPVRAAIEDVCGAAVVQARTQPGGFSPGLAARVRCANGARYFVKAVSAHANPDTPGLHRQEARVLAALEPLITSRQLPIPRLDGIRPEKLFARLVHDKKTIQGKVHFVLPRKIGEVTVVSGVDPSLVLSAIQPALA